VIGPEPTAPCGGLGDEVVRGQSWWPFIGTDENARPANQQPQESPKAANETEEMLHRRIEALEEQVRLQQEQNESQWEALVHGNKVMQQLEKEKRKLSDWRRGEEQGGGAIVGGAEKAAPPLATEKTGARQGPALAVAVEPLPSPLAQPQAQAQVNPRGANASASAVLRPGTKCRYNSSKLGGWISAVVQGFNEEDGSYNLDVRQHANVDKISPAPDVSVAEAWPSDTLIHYDSSTVKHWLPAVIRSFNEHGSAGEGTYNLDVRECASCDRIRLRLS
jgi:hypothetical protein